MSFDLDSFLPYRLNVAAAQVSRRFAALYGPEVGLSMPEWRVLAHLGQAGAVSVKDIKARVNLDKSMVSRAASSLEAAGLLRKSEHDGDRRLILLELTPAGSDLMARLGRIANRFQAELLAELGAEGSDFGIGLDRLARSGDADGTGNGSTRRTPRLSGHAPAR